MCGISLVHYYNSGDLNRTVSLESSIKAMIKSQVHRGPDMHDYYIDEQHKIALGHNRLSIIDLSADSIQPMTSSDGNYVISYNGEIYNYIELKQQLLKKGYKFKSHSDTEVVLNGYIEWGESLFNKLNGMWAFIILDKVNNKIIASRDRFGIKPMYYYNKDNKFLLASEVKAILSTGFVNKDVCLDGLNEYFTFQNIISEHTLFKDISMLKPGYNLYIDLNNNSSIKLKQYWDLEYSTDTSINEKDFCDELYNTFSKSIDRVLLSDVPVGATISGGMDSSAIVSLAANKLPHINTFTGYFDRSGVDSADRSFNENDDARLISELFNTKHHEQMIMANDVPNTLDKIVWHLEDPKVGMCYTFYLINQLLSKTVTVNLSGTGGDEILGGYPWRYQLINGVDNHNKFIDIYYNYWSRLVSDGDKQSFFNQNILAKLDINRPMHEFEKIVNLKKSDTTLNKAMYFEAKTFLHGMLMVEDKMGMAHSVETRFPFLENEMVRLSSRIPEKYKYDNAQAKVLLRKAFNKVLPETITTKRKQGFTPPDKTWYAKQLQEHINSLLLNKKSLIREYIQPQTIERILSNHNNGGDHRLLIWSMMFFESWLQSFINSDCLKTPNKHRESQAIVTDFYQ